MSETKTPTQRVGALMDLMAERDVFEYLAQLEDLACKLETEVEELQIECAFCGTENNAHHSAACVDDQAKKDKLIEKLAGTLKWVDDIMCNLPSFCFEKGEDKNGNETNSLSEEVEEALRAYEEEK